MLETQVENHALLSRAWTDSNGHRHARYHLQPAPEVVGPSHSRAHIQIEHWVTHWNAGASYVPHAKDSGNETAGVAGVNLGQSVVWLATPRVYFLVETLWSNAQQVTGSGKATWSQAPPAHDPL